jgi:hypothetical protein
LPIQGENDLTGMKTDIQIFKSLLFMYVFKNTYINPDLWYQNRQIPSTDYPQYQSFSAKVL